MFYLKKTFKTRNEEEIEIAEIVYEDERIHIVEILIRDIKHVVKTWFLEKKLII